MFDTLYRFVSTKKTRRLTKTENKFVFDTDATLTKPELKKLFEALYDINIVKIRSHNLPLKHKRVRTQRGTKPRRKRVLLTLQEGQTLQLRA